MTHKMSLKKSILHLKLHFYGGFNMMLLYSQVHLHLNPLIFLIGFSFRPFYVWYCRFLQQQHAFRNDNNRVIIDILQQLLL